MSHPNAVGPARYVAVNSEREVFEAFLKLPVAQRKMVREVILAFVKAGEKGR